MTQIESEINVSRETLSERKREALIICGMVTLVAETMAPVLFVNYPDCIERTRVGCETLRKFVRDAEVGDGR